MGSEVPATELHWTLGNELGHQYTQYARITNLIAGARYYYQVVSGEGEDDRSRVLSFQAMPAGPDFAPTLLVYGDMGRFTGAQALPEIIADAESGWPIAVIHVGDFAYDLDTIGGLNGDWFMDKIEPIASRIPYMTCIGNHEDHYNYTAYRSRFRMPGQRGSGFDNMWYSWDLGPVHFIAYSTEVYFTSSNIWTGERMETWLREDLADANKRRTTTPWIIAYGHRPMYCSNSDHDDCTTEKGKVRGQLEEIMEKGGVDLIIEAHEHSYERLWPTFNETVTQKNYFDPKAPVHIIGGAAGCNEQLGVCVNPIHTPGGPWSAFRASGDTIYGYARMTVHNATHLYWEEVLATQNDKALDSVWIVQHSHGPFSAT